MYVRVCARLCVYIYVRMYVCERVWEARKVLPTRVLHGVPVMFVRSQRSFARYRSLLDSVVKDTNGADNNM